MGLLLFSKSNPVTNINFKCLPKKEIKSTYTKTFLYLKVYKYFICRGLSLSLECKKLGQFSNFTSIFFFFYRTV